MTNTSSTRLQPSRKDENFRYTQIALNVENLKSWELEKFSQCDVESGVYRSRRADFYQAALAGIKASTLRRVESDEWQSLHSVSKAERLRGALRVRVPSGQSYKIFEHLENDSSEALLLRDIEIEAGAELEYFVLQNHEGRGQLVLRHWLDLGRGAKVSFRFFHRGAAKVQHRVSARIEEEADLRLEGATSLEGQQHVDFWAESEHVGRKSRSETTAWNVLKGESSAVFNGMIRIAPECPLTQAYQSNKSLLLSESTRVHSLPKLEIATDDVKCSHGASVSTLDSSQLFYLESRGIAQSEAESMLVNAFTDPVLSHLPLACVTQKTRKSLGMVEDPSGI